MSTVTSAPTSHPGAAMRDYEPTSVTVYASGYVLDS
jgi:hypothetical protein